MVKVLGTDAPDAPTSGPKAKRWGKWMLGATFGIFSLLLAAGLAVIGFRTVSNSKAGSALKGTTGQARAAITGDGFAAFSGGDS